MSINRVGPNDPLLVRADEWNAIGRFVDEQRRRSMDDARGGFGLTSVLIRNATGAALPQYSVVGIDAAIFDPATNLPRFAERVGVRGVSPNEAHATGSIAIIQAPCAANNIVEGVISGHTVCRVQMIDETHRFAVAEEGTTGNLVSAEIGPVALLTVQAADKRPSDTPDLAWCYVVLGALGSSDVGYFLGGYFSALGTTVNYRCAFGNGGQWHARNADDDDAQPTVIYDFAVYDGDLYAVGSFEHEYSPGNFRTILFARWDTNTDRWEDPSDGYNDLDMTEALCLLVRGGSLLIGGSCDTGVRTYNGSAYADLGTTSGVVLPTVRVMYEWGGNLYVGGSSINDVAYIKGLGMWDGSAWSQVGANVIGAAGNPGTIYAIEAHNDGGGECLYIGGNFLTIDSVNRRHIARWTGAAWQSVNRRSATENGFTTATDAQVRALRSYSGRLYIGGRNLDPGTNLAVWDGFRIEAGPPMIHHSAGGSTPPVIVHSLEIHNDGTADKLMIGGEFYYTSEKEIGVRVERVARFDAGDDAFEAIRTNGFDDLVRDLVPYDGSLYAMGLFNRTGSTECNYFAKLGGSAWAEAADVGSPCWCGAVFSVDGNDELIVGGAFTSAGGGTANRLFRWDGTNVNTVVDVDDGIVQKMRVSGSALYIVGTFNSVDSATCYGVARLTESGGVWTVTPLATYIVTQEGGVRINDLCIDGGYLYVVGNFTEIGNSNGNVTASRIARLDLGTDEWEALGTGITAEGLAVDALGGYIWASNNATTWLRRYDLTLGTWASPGGPTFSGSASRAPRMIRTIGSVIYIDYQSSTDNRTRLVRWDAVDEFLTVGNGDPAEEALGIFDRAIYTICEFDSGDGTQLHVGGAFNFVGEDLGTQVYPRNCLAAMDKSEEVAAYLGGCGQKLINAASFGLTNSVFVAKSLEVPEFTGHTVCAGGDFIVASKVTCNGIGRMTARGPVAVGLGVGNATATDARAFVGVEDICAASDGKWYMVGPFEEAWNSEAPRIITAHGIAAWTGVEFEQAGDDHDTDFANAYHIVEFGDSNGYPVLWLHTDGEGSIYELNTETGAYTARGDNIDETATLIRRLVVFNNELYAIGLIRLDGDGDYSAVRYTGSNTWVGESPGDITNGWDAVVGDIGDGTRLYVCGAVSGSDNSVWQRTTGGTWSIVGPSGTGSGAIYGVTTGLTIYDDGGTQTLMVIGGEIQSVVQQAARYDYAAGDWIGIATYGLLGSLRHANTVREGSLSLAMYEKIRIDTDNPDTGALDVDCVASYNSTDGWKRLLNTYGTNDSTLKASD